MSETDTGAADAGPFADQQRLFKLLSQDTRRTTVPQPRRDPVRGGTSDYGHNPRASCASAMRDSATM
ncbi:hypothetical protein GCM10009000_035640 [Halobacterium noricense]